MELALMNFLVHTIEFAFFYMVSMYFNDGTKSTILWFVLFFIVALPGKNGDVYCVCNTEQAKELHEKNIVSLVIFALALILGYSYVRFLKPVVVRG